MPKWIFDALAYATGSEKPIAPSAKLENGKKNRKLVRKECKQNYLGLNWATIKEKMAAHEYITIRGAKIGIICIMVNATRECKKNRLVKIEIFHFFQKIS